MEIAAELGLETTLLRRCLVWCRRRDQAARYARAPFRKDRRVNIRISSKDLEAIQKRALEEGLPYQTLIASVLHKYASRRL
jgi:predicted DNA binding CopG/RHH family protein